MMDWESAFLGAVLTIVAQSTVYCVWFVVTRWRKRVEEKLEDETKRRWEFAQETNTMLRNQLAMIKDLDERVNGLRVQVDMFLGEGR